MSFRFRITLIGIWLVFTLSLATWWMIFGLQQTELLGQVFQKAGMDDGGMDILRKQKMFLWEGAILLGSLLLGGVSLFYMTVRARKQSRRLREFFATFSHDLKTSLTSMRLQAESLKEDFSESPLLSRLLGDTVRLEVQLENSLFLADENKKLFVEDLDLEKILNTFRMNWPDIEISMSRNAIIKSDARAIESVLKNIFHNAINHGQAKKVSVDVSAGESGRVSIYIKDDGKGFSGDIDSLGQLFLRHTTSSGSGVGLYLVKELVRRQGGEVEFRNSTDGFEVHLGIEGKVL